MSSEVSKIMVGNQLKYLLEINGFITSGEIILEDLDINELTLQKYLNNSLRPSLEDIVRQANFFNSSVDYIVGNTEYVLDTWDFNFLKEFFQYSTEKINAHFEDRHNVQTTSEDNLDSILFGLLTYMTLSRIGKSFEDLTEDEITIKKAAFAEIISIFKGCITMSIQDCFVIKELRTLNKNIIDHLFGDYSFAKEVS